MPALKTEQWLAKASQDLKELSSTPRLDAELILGLVLNCSRSHLHAHPEQALSSDELKKAQELLNLRKDHYPIAYILGKKEFYGRDFQVSEAVLIPRPETEELISIVLQICQKNKLQSPQILDVGTGSGAIGLTLACELKECGAQATLSDISPSALGICRHNQEALKIVNTKIVQSDLLEKINQKYDIIVANLPYVDPSWEVGLELKHEPQNALFAEQGGLFLIDKLIDQIVAKNTLKAGGVLVLESDPEQHQAIKNSTESSGYFQKIYHQGYASVAFKA